MSKLKSLNILKKIIIYLIIIYITPNHSLQAQQFKNYKSEGLVSNTTDSKYVLSELNAQYKKAISEKDTTKIIKCLVSLSAFNRSQLHYGEAFSNSGEALFLSKEFKNALLIAKAHEEFGTLNYLFKQDKDAGENFKKAHSIYIENYKKGSISNSELFQSYYNLNMYFQRIKDRYNLEKNIENCISIIKKRNLDTLYYAFINEKKASILEWKNKDKESLELLLKSANSIETLKNNSINYSQNKSFLIIVYARIALLNEKLNKTYLAKSYFENSITIPDSTGENTFYKSFVYLRYANLLFQLADYKNAYIYLNQSKAINDTYLNPRNEDTQGFLTIKNRYEDQLRKNKELLNFQNLELAKKSQALWRFRIFFVIISLVLITISLIIRGRIKASKHKENEEKSKELLEIKNKELTTNILQLIEKDEVIKLLREHLESPKSETVTKALLRQIEKNSTSLWESFNNRFMVLNEHFYERLQEKAPDLSSADLKICALIKLNFSGKEMAHLLGISLGSVHVARHRLRKKMELERGINLTNFINSI